MARGCGAPPDLGGCTRDAPPLRVAAVVALLAALACTAPAEAVPPGSEAQLVASYSARVTATAGVQAWVSTARFAHDELVGINVAWRGRDLLGEPTGSCAGRFTGYGVLLRFNLCGRQGVPAH